jgi:arylsulfatase A-like enzyme
VLVDWDGFDPSYLGRVPMPNFEELQRRGSLSIATSTYRAISNPARTSLATGAYPATHHNAAFFYDPITNVIVGQNGRMDAENIAQSLSRQDRTIAAAGWYIIENAGAYYGNPSALYTAGGSCVAKTDNAVRIIRGEPVDSGGVPVTVPRVPDFLAVYCSELDSVGHRGGPNAPEIISVLSHLDEQLGRIVQATRDSGTYEDTTFMLVSDHGMTEFSRTMYVDVLTRLADAGLRAEILFRGQSPKPDTEVIIAENERAAGVHLRGGANNPLTLARLWRLFSSMPQIERVHTKAMLAALRAAPSEGVLVLEARQPWCFVPPPAMPPPGAEKGAHSTLREIAVPLLIAGKGIRQNAKPILPHTVDLAVTISALLGVQPPAQAEGRELREVYSGRRKAS